MKGVSELFTGMRSVGASRSAEEKKKVYLLLLFFAASMFSMKNFISMSLIEPESPSLQNVSGKAAVDAANSAKTLNVKFAAFRKLREETPQLAELAGSAGRPPVSAVTLPPKLAAETKAPEFRPEVRIKALVVLGDKRICTLDIDGEEPERIYKPGEAFGGGKGRIVSIDTKGVSWKWAGKSYRADL